MSPVVLVYLLLVPAISGVCAGLWWWQRRTGDAGIIDVAWAGGIGLGALALLVAGDGDLVTRLVVAAAIATWAVRLGGHVLRRSARRGEDGRYSDMRERLGERIQAWLFWFFQAQAGFVLVFLLPFAFIAVADPGPVALVTAAALWLLGIAGSAVADRQLDAHIADPGNRGRTCRRGLWAWSRHPNYFFEWLHWWSYPVLAVAAPWGFLALVVPLFLLWLLLRVTGIPPTERQAVKSRGDDYRRYQEEVSVFVPWPPRRFGDRITRQTITLSSEESR